MKKRFLIVATGITALTLAACGTGTTSKNVSSGEEVTSLIKDDKKVSAGDFTKVLTEYMTKQQALMAKQGQDVSSEFSDLKIHAEEVVNSDEYQEWVEASEELEKFEGSNLKDKEEKLTVAISTYNEIQAEYFQDLAKANDVDEYNATNDRLAEALNKAQEDLFDSYEAL